MFFCTQILDDDGIAAPGEIIRPHDVYINRQTPIDTKSGSSTSNTVNLKNRFIVSFHTILLDFLQWNHIDLFPMLVNSVNIGQVNKHTKVLKGRHLLLIEWHSALTGIATYVSNL